MAQERVKTYATIKSERDLQRGVRELCKACEHMRAVHKATGAPPLRLREAGFEGLARIVVGQQLSVASASAIWDRTYAAVQPFTAERFVRRRDTTYQAAGLSRAKIKTLRGIAKAITAKDIDLGDLAHLPEEQVHERLTTLPGVGPWTADVFLMFCLGRTDAWAAGDLALQVAAQRAVGMNERPSVPEMIELAERWRPWRGVAARLLWAYYRVLQDNKSGAPL